MENQETSNELQNREAPSGDQESVRGEQPQSQGSLARAEESANTQNTTPLSTESQKTAAVSGSDTPINPAANERRRGVKTLQPRFNDTAGIPFIDKTKGINLKGNDIKWFAIKVAAILASQAIVAFLFMLIFTSKSGKDNNQRFADFDTKISTLENLVAQETQKHNKNVAELAKSIDTMGRINQGILGTINTLSEEIRKMNPVSEEVSAGQQQEQKNQVSQTGEPPSSTDTPSQDNMWHLRVVTLQNVEKNKKGAEELAEYLQSKGIHNTRIYQYGKMLSVDVGNFADISEDEAKNLKAKIMEINFRGSTFKDAYFVQY